MPLSVLRIAAVYVSKTLWSAAIEKQATTSPVTYEWLTYDLIDISFHVFV